MHPPELNHLKNPEEIYSACERYLRNAGVEKPAFECRVILAQLLNLEPHRLLIGSGDAEPPIAPEQLKIVSEAMLRKASGEPTAYILGYREFFSRNFYVTPDVLIPRPETEELVEWVMQQGPVDKTLDLCCGSGVIGITLLLEGATQQVALADISQAALRIAQSNIKRLNIDPLSAITCHSDLYSSLPPGKYDRIVSNPPYVLPDEYRVLESGVRDYEPQKALLLEDMDIFHKRLIDGAREKLRPGGSIFIETSPSVIGHLEKQLIESGFGDIKRKNDLSNKARFIGAVSPRQ